MVCASYPIVRDIVLSLDLKFRLGGQRRNNLNCHLDAISARKVSSQIWVSDIHLSANDDLPAKQPTLSI
jgi:hypothetical protein